MVKGLRGRRVVTCTFFASRFSTRLGCLSGPKWAASAGGRLPPARLLPLCGRKPPLALLVSHMAAGGQLFAQSVPGSTQH